MKTLLQYAAICVLATTGSLGQEASPKIVLPEVRLLDLGITTRWEASRAGIITRVTVTEVLKRSSAWTSGLREGDALEAIDHRQVVGMHRDDYLAALEVPLTPGNPRVYTFSMSRGFGIVFTSGIDLVVELKPKAVPPQAPPKAVAHQGG